MTAGGLGRIDFGSHRFHPVVHLPPDYEVLDLSGSAAAERLSDSPFTIGRYDEDRGIYTSPLFAGGRSIHVGIDIGAPPGTAVYAPAAGFLYAQGDNAGPGDYGPTLITQHRISGIDLWILYGHLRRDSLELRPKAAPVAAGDLLGWIGGSSENGGWPPHLHFQLSYRRPDGYDLPGVVPPEGRQDALRDFPDPRGVLGPLY